MPTTTILRFIACALALSALACHAESAPPPEYPALPATAVAPAEASPAVTPTGAPLGKGVHGTEIAGEWVEFWALDGAADTQRYVFGADGHFEWSAEAASKDAVLATFGDYAYDGTNVTLTIKAERPRGGKCTDGCKSPVEPARSVQLQVEDCPPNEEARALDANYRCLSFGDHAFWMRGHHVAH